MKYEVIKGLDDEKFRRLTGVKKSTFVKMIEILSEAEKKKRAKTYGVYSNSCSTILWLQIGKQLSKSKLSNPATLTGTARKKTASAAGRGQLSRLASVPGRCA